LSLKEAALRGHDLGSDPLPSYVMVCPQPLHYAAWRRQDSD